jgi:kynurenine formamidase
MIHDLSVPLTDQTPVFPGDPRLEITTASTIAETGCMLHSVKLGTHNGTHIDAPAHMIEGAATLGQIPVETFVGTGKLVEGFSVEALEALEAAGNGIAAGDIVLFHTGASERFDEEWYFTGYPVMPDEVADWLVAKGVKLVGLDTCSADNVEGFPIHKKLLGAGIPIIETLRITQDTLAALRGQQFDVYALPLKLDLDGAPARVIAVCDDSQNG